MRRWTPLLLLTALFAAACTSTSTPFSEVMLERRSARLELNESVRDSISRRWPTPLTLEYGEHGTLYVDEVSLGGLPGNEYLHIHFTWVNTTERKIDTVRMQLELFHPDSEEVLTQDLELSLPMKLSLLPSSCYTNWVDLVTEGTHLVPGWDWQLRLDTVVAED